MANQVPYSAMPATGFVVTVVCETPAILAAVRAALSQITPAAYIPDRVIAHDLASALMRDLPAVPEQDYGNPVAPIVLDDDEEPPLRACPTGGCGLD